MLAPEADRAVVHELVRPLFAWYARHARALPWRQKPTPYAIWVSEIMLQQTRMETAVPRWRAFVARFPSVAALARAREHEVCEAWAGLGYYSRARNLHRAAQAIVARHGGRLPDTAAALLALPGIGRYTAGAIASIAFGRVEPVVDGNVVRVLSRLLGLSHPANTPVGQAAFWRHAGELTAAAASAGSPGDWNQAVMELGATVCRPQRPTCAICPWMAACHARRTGTIDQLPVKVPKRAPVALEMAYALHVDGRGLLLEQRPLSGLWAGLWEPPSAAGEGARGALEGRGFRLGEEIGQVEHVLTHRLVRARVFVAEGRAPSGPRGVRRRRSRRPAEAPLSSLARKVVALGEGLLAGRPAP